MQSLLGKQIMFGIGNMLERYNLIVNTNQALAGEIVNIKETEKKERLIKQALDLAKLSQNLLKSEEFF